MKRFLLLAASALALVPLSVVAKSVPAVETPEEPETDAVPEASAAATPAPAPVTSAPVTSAPATSVPAEPAKATVSAVRKPPVYGAWGVDLTARDLTVKPGDDFQRFATGAWLDSHPIPPDKPSISSGLSVYERTQSNLRRLIIKAPADSGYGIMFNTFMDTAKVESDGIAALKADIARLDGVKSQKTFARAMGGSYGKFGAALVDISADGDTADPTMNVLWIGQGGLGLPDRDYYLNDQFKPQREAYQAYIQRVFAMLGHADPAGDAAKVFAFEKAIADKSWAMADRRDISKINNPMTGAEFAAYAPGLDWKALLAGAGIGPQKRIIVQEKTAIRDIAALYAATPLATLKLWEEFQIVAQAGPYLPKAWVDSRFEYVKTLSGVTAQRARWMRGVALVDTTLGELVGQAYVKAYFPPEAKTRMEALVDNLLQAMGERIRANDWMSPATKAAALNKLAKTRVMVGYPDKFRDYSKLKLVPGDLYGNVERANAFNFAYQMSDLGKPVDRAKWVMNPQEVDAYNGPLENKIVFPAGILQPPFFNLKADDAVNYGAAGAIIGHEISHSFDDQGRKIDATGKVRDWWGPEDGRRFEARAKIFGEQYAKFEAAPGAFVKPELTMGENIADFAGLQVALTAYHRSLGGKDAPVIDGLTGDQRFFLAYAQAWRGKEREDSVRLQVTSDPHSPRRFRLIGPLRNIDEWYAAFGVGPGDKMYIPPEQRARIW